MNRTLICSGLAAGALALSGLAVAPTAIAMPAGHPASMPDVHACTTHPAKGHAACYAIAVAAASGRIVGSARPLEAAFGPADIQAAYNLTGLKSGGRTVAIVDAYGYPTLESDLAEFRSNYGLPACTTANGCLTIEGQTGGAAPGGSDQGWDLEQALDVDAVSSACPDCKILVVEANSSFSDLEVAEDTAAGTAGVVAISNSYGGGDMSDVPAYDHAGIAITSSTGDDGYQEPGYPATDNHVVAVGGTSVTKSGSTYTETAWSGAGSGCGMNPKPRWQHKVHTTCSTRAESDTAAAADPNNGGLNVYDSGYGGWIQVGGTSESSPIIAAVFALSGKTKKYPARYLYQKKHAKFLHDITSGSTGSCGFPLCQAGPGWDGPTGMGTPNGVKAY